MARRRFIIERDIPKVGSLERAQLRDAAAKSNEALDQLAPNIHWVESYVAIFHEAELKDRRSFNGRRSTGLPP